MPVQDGRLVVDARAPSCRPAAAGVGAAPCAAPPAPAAARRSGISTANIEPRPGSELQRDGWSSTRAMRSTIDRPSPRPRAALAPWSRRWNSRNTDLLLGRRECRGRCPRPRSHARRGAAGSRRARGPSGVLDGVRDEVLQQPAQQPAVRADRQRATARRSSSRPFSRAMGSNSSCSWPEQLLDAEARDLRLHRAGVEARDVEQRVEDLLDGVEGGVDVFGERRLAARRGRARRGKSHRGARR